MRLDREHVNAPDRGPADGWRGDNPQQIRRLGNGVGNPAQGRIHFAPRVVRCQGHRDCFGNLPCRGRVTKRVDVVAIATVGRDASSGGVRMVEIAELLKTREFVAHGGGAVVQAITTGEVLTPNGLARVDVHLDHHAQH